MVDMNQMLQSQFKITESFVKKLFESLLRHDKVKSDAEISEMRWQNNEEEDTAGFEVIAKTA